MRHRHRTIRLFAIAALVAGALAAGPTAGAAGADDFGSATAFGGPFPFVETTNTTGFGTETGEPIPCSSGHDRSAWYSYTPAATTQITADTSGSDYDTVLAVYTGVAVDALTLVVCNNNISAADLDSRVTFTAVAGTTYYFQVSSVGSGSAGGNLMFRVPVPWDDFFYPRAITALTYTDTGNTTAATLQAGEPVPTACVGGAGIGHSVWYAYTPAVGSPVVAETGGSGFDTVLAVYTGTAPGALTQVVCNDDISGSDPDSRVTFNAVAGTTYYLQVSSYGSGSAGGSLSLQVTVPWDDFSYPKTVAALPYSDTGSTAFATLQAGEKTPSCAPSIAHSVWYVYTPGVSTQVVADTSGSTYNTVLAVWTGATPATLSQVACNNDISATNQDSRLIFSAVAGQTYYIQVSSYGAGSAAGSLVFRMAVPWDDFSYPRVITTLPYTDTGSTATATLQTGEPVPTTCVGASGIGRSVWYAYTAATSTPLVADTVGSSYDTVLAVYTGSTVTGLSPVVCNDDISATDADSRVTFNAAAGTTYYFQVSGFGAGSAGGNLVFHLSAGPQPPWDQYGDPFVITDPLPFADLGVDTTLATVQSGEPTPTCVNKHGYSVWYSYTPGSDVSLVADTFGSDYDTVLQVYEGSWSRPVACNNDADAVSQSEVSFTARAGMTYLFQVSSRGHWTEGGLLDFHLDGDAVAAYCRGVEATIVGTAGADVIRGTSGADVIVALGGDDLILGLAGDDLICAGAGNDTVYAGAGFDRVFGQGGDDLLQGGAGDDDMFGWGGADVLLGKNGGDKLVGGAGDDELYGAAGEDDVRGGGGDDALYGGAHDDLLFGNAGFDVLRGGGGDDLCYSGEDVIC